MKQIALWIFVLAITAPCFGKSTGTVSENGISMEVKSAVTLIEPTEPLLRVVLLAFEPTAEEIKKLQSGDKLWILDHPTPDSKKWPTKCPFAVVEFSWSGKKASLGDTKAAYFYMTLYGISNPDNTNTVNKSGKDIDSSLTGQLKPGKEVEFRTKGTGNVGTDKIEWNLNIKEAVLELKK